MTKARSKSAKRRAKAGRKKLLYVAREPNGRISRSGIPHEPADTVAVEARMRHTGLSAQDARDQKAATFIGYLNILGRRDGLSNEQYDAAIDFLDLRAAYLRAIKAPNASMSSEMRGSSGDLITEEYELWCRSVIQRYADCRKAIMEAQMENRTENLWAAVDYCMLREEWHSHMIPALRVVCNALGRFFRG